MPNSLTDHMAGVLLVHGYTSTPQSVDGLAAALVGAGFDVEVPLLPGHGTTVEDLDRRRWGEWTAAVDEAWANLAARHPRAVVAGLSMGGTLATWLAATRPPALAGLATLNPMIDPPAASFRELLRAFLADGHMCLPGPANDVSEPGAREVAYPLWPIEPMLSLFEAQDDLLGRLAQVTCPTLIVTSGHDHVVPPVSSDMLAAGVTGPVERIVLERSFHLATLDVERDVLEAAVVAFARRVCELA
ncbi:MAG: carboxylesterase [Actinomycetota bacterium]|nr:carboxylesterase [Actinomycetota bacterium]